MIYLELALVGVLILMNGALAMSEMALVSARAAKLKAMAAAGDRGAAQALDLIDNPGRLLSTVQIGITLIGVLAGTFSGATLAERLAATLLAQGLSPGLAEALAFGVVVSAVTYLSLIVGELVPKQYALARAERIAALVARPLRLLAKLSAPAVWLLDLSSSLALRALGLRKGENRSVDEEELRLIIAEAESSGLVEPEERTMMSRVLSLSDRPVGSIITPRNDIEWVDLNDPPDAILHQVARSRHERLLASNGSIDEFVGILSAKDLLTQRLAGGETDIRAAVRKAVVIPESLDVFDAMRVLQNTWNGPAVVIDEYGALQGLVSLSDVVEALSGQVVSALGHGIARRDDGSLLIDGMTPVGDAGEQLGLKLEAENFNTFAGWLIGELRHIPKEGASLDRFGWRFEIVDMDGRRIDKVLARRIAED